MTIHLLPRRRAAATDPKEIIPSCSAEFADSTLRRGPKRLLRHSEEPASNRTRSTFSELGSGDCCLQDVEIQLCLSRTASPLRIIAFRGSASAPDTIMRTLIQQRSKIAAVTHSRAVESSPTLLQRRTRFAPNVCSLSNRSCTSPHCERVRQVRLTRLVAATRSGCVIRSTCTCNSLLKYATQCGSAKDPTFMNQPLAATSVMCCD